MAANKEQCIALLQSAINILDDSFRWEDQAYTRAQMLSVHGEKRRERHEARKDYMLQQHLKCLAVDLFDMELKAAPTSIVLPKTDIPGYFDMYLKKLWKTYDELHKVANDLVVAGYKHIAEPIYCHLDCVFDEIIETKRTIKEGNLANWEFHHVSRYQVGYYNVHDCMEKKEQAEGYKY